MENKFWLLGIHRYIIADGSLTQGLYDLIEGVALPGTQTPPHIHHEYAETEYVLEGELTIFTDTETVVLQPGQGYTIPKGKPHSLFASAQVPTKTMTVFAPAGFAQVIREAGLKGKLSEGPPVQGTAMEQFNKLSTAIGDVTLGAPGTFPW